MTDPAPRRQRPEIRTHLRDVTSGDGGSTRARTSRTTGPERAADDAVLMEALGRGDIQALEQLYDRYSALVFSVSLRVLHDPQLAEDVVQEVFIQVWKSAERFDPRRAAESTWIAAIARNRLVDQRRRAGSGPGIEVLEPDSATVADEGLRRADVRDEARVARTAFLRLAPEQQRLLSLSILDGLSHGQIAERTGIALGTVKSRLRSGLVRLRELLGRTPCDEEVCS